MMQQWWLGGLNWLKGKTVNSVNNSMEIWGWLLDCVPGLTCANIFHLSFVVILDSSFCVLKGIIKLRKKAVFVSTLIKKQQYWPRYIRGDEIKAHFANKEVGDTDSWAGLLDNVPFDIYSMKEPDYVMLLMSTYGMNSRDSRKET